MIDIITKIHDNFSVEFKISLIANRNIKENDFIINTWIFVPNSLDINSMTYNKNRFYNDVRSNIRLITPIFSLSDIVSNNAIPLNNIKNALKLADEDYPSSVIEYEYQIKMFMAILKSSLRDNVNSMLNKIENIEIRHKIYKENVENILREYRKIRNIIPEDSKNLLNYFSFGDEFMCSAIESNIFYFITKLEKISKPIYKDIILQLKQLIKEVGKYKEEKGYLMVERHSPTNNKELIFRRWVLKKYIDSDLFLKSNRKKDGFVVEQLYYSLAAGISMVFATVIAFSFQQKYGNFTMPLFLALVIGYMGKDRIKDFMRYYYLHRLSTKYFDNKTTITIKNNEPLGWSKEAMDFIPENKVPKEIMDARNRSLLLEAENKFNNEKIILYRKRISLDSEKLDADSRYLIIGINDITRFYVNRFTQKMDNPRIPLYTLDSNDNVSVIKGDKIYYLNFILQLQYENNLEYKRFRVVFNRTGILDIEKFVV